MTVRELRRHRNLLEKKKVELDKELAEAIRDRDDLLVKAPDELDAAALTLERELAIERIDALSKTIREVRLALQRVEDRTYGLCLNCDEEISPVRLKAVPWARHCRPCQDELDAVKCTAAFQQLRLRAA